VSQYVRWQSRSRRVLCLLLSRQPVAQLPMIYPSAAFLNPWISLVVGNVIFMRVHAMWDLSPRPFLLLQWHPSRLLSTNWAIAGLYGKSEMSRAGVLLCAQQASAWITKTKTNIQCGHGRYHRNASTKKPPTSISDCIGFEQSRTTTSGSVF
jgi:hypothetical protein